jgi:hypothetical protein
MVGSQQPPRPNHPHAEDNAAPGERNGFVCVVGLDTYREADAARRHLIADLLRECLYSVIQWCPLLSCPSSPIYRGCRSGDDIWGEMIAPWPYSMPATTVQRARCISPSPVGSCLGTCCTARMPSLLTAWDAAKLLGVSESTTQRRAREAAKRGDAGVHNVGGHWAATEERWREHVKLRPAGRPRRHRPSDAG